MADNVFTPTTEMNQILRDSGSHNKEVALAATAELAKALDDILGHLRKRMKFAQRASAAGRSEVCGLRGRGGGQLNAIACGLQGGLEFDLSGVDGLAGNGTLFPGQRAELSHQACEASLRPNPLALGAIK